MFAHGKKLALAAAVGLPAQTMALNMGQRGRIVQQQAVGNCKAAFKRCMGELADGIEEHGLSFPTHTPKCKDCVKKCGNQVRGHQASEQKKTFCSDAYAGDGKALAWATAKALAWATAVAQEKEEKEVQEKPTFFGKFGKHIANLFRKKK